MRSSQNIELSSVNGWEPPGLGGGWWHRCLNQRGRCLTQGDEDEREEGDGKFVEHQPLLLSPSQPAAVPRSAHVIQGSNTGPTAAHTDQHPHTTHKC